MIDPVDLTQRLVRCASVTPEDDGALGIVADALRNAGFDCTDIERNGIKNLFARWGPKGHAKTFGFNGHTDVVPPGDPADWRHPPFSGEIDGGVLYGRGATDMKSGVAAFIAAAAFMAADTPPDGAIVLAITGDEEGDGVDGTAAILDWMADAGEAMSVCLVGEPTSQENVGDMIKIGRRGSMTAHIQAAGVQGHSAYPHNARNPIHALVDFLSALKANPLDDGTAQFDPSTLQITGFDVGNAANNVIPAQARAMVNIRFNDAHSSESLSEWIKSEASRVSGLTGVSIDLAFKVSGESFVTPPGPLTDLVSAAIVRETGEKPVLSTSGGTSDARFITHHCPVVEVGLVGRTMHQIDERVDVAQIHTLKSIYTRILREYFA